MVDPEDAEDIAIRLISLMENCKIAIESLRLNAGGQGNGWDARGLSIAMTHLETAQLWVANAKAD